MLQAAIGNFSLRFLQHQIFQRRNAFPTFVAPFVVGFFLNRAFEILRQTEQPSRR